MAESDSLLESDVLISDWSAMAIEYALGLGKPVLFVDVPPRVRNPNYAELGIEPMEMRIRRELGTVLPLDRVRMLAARGGASEDAAGSAAQRRVAMPGLLTSAGAWRWGGIAASRTSGRAQEPSGAAVHAGRRRGGEVSARRRLLRWGSWFAPQRGAPGSGRLRHFWYYSALQPSFAWIYAIPAFLGQMTALATRHSSRWSRHRLGPAALGVLPSAWCWPAPFSASSFSTAWSCREPVSRRRPDLPLAPLTWAFALYFLVGAAIEAMLALWV
jgi:hypothetical protein